MKKRLIAAVSMIASVFCSAYADLIPNDQFAILYPSAYDITAPYDANDVRCYEENCNGGAGQFCIFDNATTKTYWLGQNGRRPSITYRVDTPVVVEFYSILLPTDVMYSQTYRYQPDNFTFYGSNDFDGSNMSTATWDALDTQFGQKEGWNAGTKHIYSCNPSKTAYTSYKLVIHGATPTSNVTIGHQTIRQLEFLALPVVALNISANSINDLPVSPAYGDILASEDCPSGHVFTCTAPASGTSVDGLLVYTFSHWELREGADEDSPLIDQGTNTTATFTYNGTKLSLKWFYDEEVLTTTAIAGEGSVLIGNEFISANTPTPISATPAEGWKFFRWVVINGSVLDPQAASTSVVMEAPGSIRALFIPQSVSSIDLYVDPIHGSDENSGFSPDAAFASVLTAVEFLTPYQEGTIHLFPGTYTTNEDITLTEGLSLIGESGNPNDVVIGRTRSEGYFDSRCVVLNHPQAFVANMTLSNGYVRTSYANGGGLNILEQGGSASNLVITSCFSDGSTSYGIGACLKSNQALLTHSIIRECTSSVNPAGQAQNRGLGVHIYAGRIANCLIEDCRQGTVNAESSAGALALRPTGNDTATAVHCTVVNCIGGKTGGILAEGSARVYNTVVAGCTGFPPEEGEAAIAPWTGSAACFVNCATDGAEPINDSCLAGTYATFFEATKPGVFRPAESLLDRGTTELPNGLPASDFFGNPRLVGLAPDIGYFEVTSRATLILLK